MTTYISKNKTITFSEHTKSKNKYCSRLCKKERKFFFNNLNLKFFSGSKLFWKTLNPLFLTKQVKNANVKLTDEITQNDEKFSETLKMQFPA